MSAPTAEDAVRVLEQLVHDLAQPMTTLRCRLELARVEGPGADLRDAIDGGIADCCRMFVHMEGLRAAVIALRAAEGCDA